ncbi:Short chain oxidoreductase [Bifidobacterium actinocoloniiforme DSM 22766]|uniref:Short chain oxidoreductase n=1 Tax=Bifidobacterium actinocoloniiforme DSM 22766 TaxID=1437605 RepID=A0A086Z2A4_9BIFI|nr:SDR family oxidoreductase [Bifidobacterium actinocoloniiforme]KFI40654.1 Short chain oxidoreductase [Bifidobacterium actinocoloniiforme DSM 22766]
MNKQTWLITGVNSGFGLELTRQLLAAGHKAVGTIRRESPAVAELKAQYPDTLETPNLDVTDVEAVHRVVGAAFERQGRVDVVVNNAGYGLFGAAEELSDQQVEHIIATNLLGSIQVIRTALPYLRRQGAGIIVQISSYGGQVAYPGNSMYHATKFGIEGFVESVAQEVKPFGIRTMIVEPGGARTEFRYGSAQVAQLMPEYDGPTHAFLKMLDPANGLAPGDPAEMAARIIECAADPETPPACRIRLRGPAQRHPAA